MCDNVIILLLNKIRVSSAWRGMQVCWRLDPVCGGHPVEHAGGHEIAGHRDPFSAGAETSGGDAHSPNVRHVRAAHHLLAAPARVKNKVCKNMSPSETTLD